MSNHEEKKNDDDKIQIHQVHEGKDRREKKDQTRKFHFFFASSR